MKHNFSFKLFCTVFTITYNLFFLSATSYRNAVLNSSINTLEPMKGIVLWPDNDAMSTLKNSIVLEYSYCLPCKVVTGKSNGKITYDWSSFEDLLDDIASRNHQAIVRFRYEYPGSDGKITGTDYCTCNVAGATAVPLYIKNLSGYSETYNKNSDGATYYADWSNAELKWFTKQFYADFAAKYDNDPRIAFIQLGFGHWSEYHIYGTTLKLGTNFPDFSYQTEFLQYINSQFTETPWSISIDAADDSYAPITGSSVLMALNFGLFDDSFMHSEHDRSQGEGYNEECWVALDTISRWKKAPCGGEISYYTSKDQKNFLNPSGMYGVTWEQAAAKYHMTYVIGNDAPSGSYATAARVKEAGMNAGYKFQITKYQLSDASAIVTVKNVGVAAFYHNAYVTVKNVRSTTSLKGLLPGNSIQCTVSGISVAANETPAVTITSDKILSGVTIPYEASLEADPIVASPPTCTLAASALTIAPNVDVTLTATAESASSTISKVVIKQGSTTKATLTSLPYTYVFTPTAEGSYTFTATATDAEDLSTISNSITITCRSVAAPSTGNIVVDGTSSDWNNVPVLSEPAVEPSLKLLSGTDTLWYMLKNSTNYTATLDNKYPTAYIDADRKASTGNAPWQYPAAGRDYERTTGYNNGGSWVDFPAAIQNNVIEVAVPHSSFTGVQLADTFGFAVYYGNVDFYLPLLNVSYNHAYPNALLNMYCVKPRTTVAVSSSATLTAANAYFHPYMGSNMTTDLNFYPTASSSMDTCMWASWAIDLKTAAQYAISASVTATTDYSLDLTLVDMATNAVVATLPSSILSSVSGTVSLGTLDLSAVSTGKYMLKVKNRIGRANLKVQSLTLILAKQGIPTDKNATWNANVAVNQMNGILTVTSLQPMEVYVFSLQGAKVAEQHHVIAADFELGRGIYLLQTKIAGQIATHKVVIR